METPLNERTCTISAAGEAIGRGPETVRGWLQRGGGPYLFSTNQGGWRRFFGADIAIMALAAPMIEFGIQPEFAFKMAREIIVEQAEVGKPSWAQAKHLAAILAEKRLLVRNDADRWRAVLVSDRHDIANLGGSALVLNPCALIRDAFWRMDGEID